MIRLRGQPQTLRTFCLALLLAIMLLVGVSSRSVRATAEAGEPELGQAVGTLLALGEALRHQPPKAGLSPIHPELADNGRGWLRSLTVRQARSLKEQLAELKLANVAGRDAEAYRTLALEADRLLMELVAFGSAGSDPAKLRQSLERLAAARPRPADPSPATASRPAGEAAPLPLILRGSGP